MRDGQETELPEVSYTLKNAARQIYVSCDRKRTKKTTAICTVALGDGYRKSVDYCLQSQERYAKKAGADYVMLHLMPAHVERHPAWYKIPLVFKLLQEGYERVLFIDADAMVTNYDVTLDRLFAPLAGRRESFLIAEDEGGLNTGIFMIQKNPATYRMLDLIWTHNLGNHLPNWEQQALVFLINWYKPIQDYVLIAPDPKAFNSFPYEREHIYRVIQRTIGRRAISSATSRAFLKERGVSDFSALQMRYNNREVVDANTDMYNLPEHYFVQAAKRMPTDRKLLLITNSATRADIFGQKHLGDRDYLVVSHRNILIDFYLLTRASFVAISNSTFGWWGAYLNPVLDHVHAPIRRR